MLLLLLRIYISFFFSYLCKKNWNMPKDKPGKLSMLLLYMYIQTVQAHLSLNRLNSLPVELKVFVSVVTLSWLDHIMFTVGAFINYLQICMMKLGVQHASQWENKTIKIVWQNINKETNIYLFNSVLFCHIKLYSKE